MKDYTKLYAAIFWISLLSIFLLLILKARGYINTPPLLELFPFFSAFFAGGAFFQLALSMNNRLSKAESTLFHHEKRLMLLEHTPLKVKP